MLDSGAPHLVLNLTYFRDYVTTTTDAEQSGITGSGPPVVKTTVKAFSFGSLNFSKLEADLVGLGHIENTKGIRILGLLGMELFRQCEMIIDYEKNLIYLHRIGRKEASVYKHELLNDTAAYRTFPIDLTDNRIIATTMMAGKKLKLIIDCAAESNVLDSRLPNKIFDQVTITRRVTLTGAGNKKVDALYGDLQNMQIGGLDIGTLPVLITNLENTCISYGGCIDGILGFDFLSLHKIGFNFVNRKMYIWK
ncbi:MAG TPA: retropepsin-like aspartic protease [Flavisolibacter sp.]|nr:retropepsin-like aspartic protease [Flavisolibacter sp.]